MPRLGASWVARPIPWPVPWPKWSPWPASAMTARATASTARPLGEPRPPPADGRLQRRDRRRLGPRDELVDVEVARGRLADEQRPGHVAAVAVDLRAEVEQQHGAVAATGTVAAASRAAAPPRAGQAGDVERERLGAAGPHQPLEPQRELRLRHPGPDLGQQRRERPVGDRAGRRDPLELGRLLGRPVRLDPALDRHELDVRRGGGEPLPGRVRDEPGLDARPAAPRPTPTRSGQRAGRSWYASKSRASGASRRAWIV